MEPANFKESNVIFGKDQAEYCPLPAYRDAYGVVVSCWRMSFKERLIVLFSGRVWASVLTFNRPIQPSILSARKGELLNAPE